MFPENHKSKFNFKFWVSLVFLASISTAFAQLTDIASKPIAGAATVDVKPNIMLLMDTSQSMSFSHMPDEVEGLQVNLPIGYKSYQCNALYYNPNTVYVLPKDSLGVNLATPSFTSARHSYYSATDTALVNLSTAFQAYDTTTRQNQASTANDVAQPAYYYVYTGTATLNYATDPCTQTDTGVSGFAGNITATGGNWTRKIVSATSGINSTDERTNFAIWYTYYRTRMAMTKSSLSRAFVTLTDSFRVGFVSANPGTPVAAAKYQALNDFNPTNKAAWYAKVFSQEPSGSSPMREGLARVGRHYGGMMDGINQGMTPDPVSYSCQKNFTLMTTDGYWNAAAETAGPVQLDGVTLVGKQDNILTQNANWTPRPIWDGGSTSIRTTTDQSNTYSTLACVGAYEYQTTAQITQVNSQVKQSTTQPLQTTVQNLQTTKQTTKTINQALASTTQPKQSTSQTSLATSQILASTSQLQQIVTKYQQWTTTWYATQTTVSMSTTQTVASYAQVKQSTAQKTQTQTQLNQSTSQTTQTLVQALLSTSQVTQSTSRTTASTTQNLVSTTRQDQTVSQAYQSTSQLNSYNGLTELQTPVATCTAGGGISCITVTSGPTLVASCTAATANSTNAYTNTTCSTTIVSGPTPVATCAPVSATSTNSYQSTTCTTVATGPTPAATCSAISPTSANSYTATSCTTNNTGPTAVASCTTASASSGNSYTATTCTPINTGPTAVSTCSSITATAGNSYTTTSCGTSTTGPTAVQTCTPSGPTNGLTTTCSGGSVTFVQTCTPQTASSTNSWTTITCNTATTGPTPVASCTPQTAASSNNWQTITCPTLTIFATAPVQTCSAVTASSSNNYTATVCANGPLYVAANTFVQTCTAATATAPDWATTTCTPVTSGPTGVSSCTNTAATSSNSWKTTTCATNTTGPTLVVQGGCTAATAASGNSWKATGCTTATVSAATASAACVNVTANSGILTNATAANGYVTTTCSQVGTARNNVQTCTPGDTISGAVVTSCQLVGPTTTGVASCTPASPTLSNSWQTVTCNTATTTDVPSASCTPASASSANSYVATTCRTATTTAVVDPTTCTASTASSSNSYVATTCPAATTGPTAVQVCTPVTATAANNWTTTSCTSATTGPTGVQTCTPITGTSANSWVTTTCSSSTDTGTTYVASTSCTPQTAASGNSWKTIACSTATLTSNVPVATCSASTTGSPNYIETTCPTPVTTGPTAVASCTGQAASSANNFVTTTCPSPNTTGPTAVTPSSCLVDTTTTPGTPIAKTTTVGSPTFITTTCTPVVSSTLVASCTPTSPIAGNSYTTTGCNTYSTGPTQVSAASCTNAAATSSNNYVATTCTPLPAHKIQYQTTTSQLVEYLSNSTLVKTIPLTTSTTAIADLDGVCYTDGVDPLPAQPAKPTPLTGCTAWPCVVTVNTAVGGSANSLADVAQYYYVTDLRPTTPPTNAVKATGTGLEDDTATHQHMTTFGLGLGVAGTINYQSNYKTALTGDFANIRAGALNWPAWPDLSVDYTNALNYNNTKSIDDFWHAAVNGRGDYFSAGDPQAVVDGLSSALAKINTVAGSGGAATPSNNTPVPGDNASFLTSFITQEWTGDLQSRAVDLSTGVVTTTVSWSARDKLDAMTGAACDNRVIYFRKTTATNNLGNFTWNTQICDASGLPTGALDTGLTATEQAYFGSTTVANFSQYAAMSDGSSGTVNQRSLASGANLVNFIRGQRGLEGFVANSGTKLYRARSHVLSDIVGSVAKFVKAPSSTYSDAGYAAFKTSQASRTPMIYVGSNGGMLHAFYAPNSASDPQIANAGKEAWAYIPQPLLSDLYRLADNNYQSNHHYYVDGSPSSGDIYDTTAGAWKTILVGGLGAGGKGYYALDITNPTTPKSLWEFNFSAACSGTGVDCNLGLTFGRPVISKLADGTWVVFITSGYNNVGSSTGVGDGLGYLYVLNAMTGTVISKISTGVGTATNPSGLRDVNNYVANGAVDNKTLRVYGGDLMGNVWRFDVNDTIAPTGKEATLVGITKDSLGATQPITTRVQLSEVDGKTMILVGTGKFLGSSDASTTQTQSIYGFKDTPGAAIVYSNLRGSLKPLTLTQSGTIRTSSCTGSTTTCALSAGWVIDLPESMERVNVDPFIVSGTVVFSSNVPSNSACQAGGHSWLNYVSITSGGVVSTSVSQEASSQLNDSLSVGLSYVILPDGRVVATSVGSDASTSTREIPIAPPDPMGRRVSWREIKR